MSAFLSLQSVSKRFQDHLAVDKVSFEIEKGQIYALLGPNGAGKTTIIRMITGIFVPDEGEIILDDSPLRREDMARMGYMPEERGLYKKTKVIEQITYLLRLKGLSNKQAKETAQQWLDKMGLGEWANKLTTDLSKGMQQKVQFISTVAHEPDLVILDEPVSGLDPVNAKLMEQEILQLKAKGKTIIFSTHRLEQVEELCDSLALVHKGKLLLNGSVNEVRNRFQKNEYRVVLEGESVDWSVLPQAELLSIKGNEFILKLKEDSPPNELLRYLAGLNVNVLRFEKIVPKLTDIFIELVGDAKELERE